MKNFNRRDFLATGSCGMMSSLTAMNALIQLRVTGNAVAGTTDSSSEHKALVCIFLDGGNDSYNMLVPTASDEYTNYAASRSNMALPNVGSTNGVLPLTSLNTPGRTFGVNPAMEGIQRLFNDQKAAFIANVGTLVEPIPNAAAYSSGNFKLPRALFSHFDQQDEWQTSLPQDPSAATGWGGRMADLTNLLNDPTGKVPMSYSLSGNNTYQTGTDVVSYTITRDGAIPLNGLSQHTVIPPSTANTAASLMEQTYRSVLEQAYTDETRNSIDSFQEFSTAINGSSITTTFPGSDFGRDLEMTAKSIASANALGQKRQIFFIRVTQWDDHASLLTSHGPRLSALSAGIEAFQQAMVDLDMEDNVTLYTMSEFSRTLRSNGLGTDHAWGGNHIVTGGAVKGGRIYGDYPDNLLLGQGQDVGANGRLLPSTSCDLYFAELAQWFGVSAPDLYTVLPNLSRFHSASATSAPMGFLL